MGVIYRINGKTVTREEFLQGPNRLKECLRKRRAPGGNSPSCWPQHSDTLAVHPEQIAEYREYDAARGVPTNYDAQGRPIFESRGHRKRYYAAHNAFDGSAGYGDQAPQHS